MHEMSLNLLSFNFYSQITFKSERLENENVLFSKIVLLALVSIYDR